MKWICCCFHRGMWCWAWKLTKVSIVLKKNNITNSEKKCTFILHIKRAIQCISLDGSKHDCARKQFPNFFRIPSSCLSGYISSVTKFLSLPLGSDVSICFLFLHCPFWILPMLHGGWVVWEGVHLSLGTSVLERWLGCWDQRTRVSQDSIPSPCHVQNNRLMSSFNLVHGVRLAVIPMVCWFWVHSGL